MSSSEDHTHCPICFENYDLGDRTPRILPCFHSLCHGCINDLLKQSYPDKPSLLECPLCRKKHKTRKKGPKAFRENAYIVSFIQNASVVSKCSKITVEPNNNYEFRRCILHESKLAFYCKGEYCEEVICAKCLRAEHTGEGHEVVDLEEEHEERIVFLKSVIQEADDAGVTVVEMRKDAERRHEKIAHDIEELREKNKVLMKNIEDLFQRNSEISKRNELSSSKTSVKLLDQNRDTLKDMLEKVNQSGCLPDKELIETIQSEIQAICEIAEEDSENQNFDRIEIKLEITKDFDSVTSHVEIAHSDQSTTVDAQGEDQAKQIPGPGISLLNMAVMLVFICVENYWLHILCLLLRIVLEMYVDYCIRGRRPW